MLNNDYKPTKEHKQKIAESVKQYHRENPNIYRGKKSFTWKGGITRRYARSIWEKWWNQIVPDGYDVHHVDGNKRNNYITNLALVTHVEHSRIHRRRDIRNGELYPFWNKSGVEVEE